MSLNFANPIQHLEHHPSWLRKWSSLIVMSLALAIIVIDTTLLNVSIGTIIRELHTDLESIQWVITAYALVLAAFTITGGRLGDFFGRKKMFVLGAAIFALGSFIASISTSVGMLIAGEAIIEGVGAALMMPATASLLVSNFKGRDRALAFGVWGGIAAASSAIGPILGGYLTSHFSWRWGFRINVFVAALLIVGSVLVREARDQEEKPELDYLGVLLSAIGLFLMVFGFIKSSTYGWWHALVPFTMNGTVLLSSISPVPLFILFGVAVLGVFVWWQRRRTIKGRTPLVSLSLFRNRQFTVGACTAAVLSLGMSGMVFVLPIFFQAVRGLDAFSTGIALLPLSLSLLVMAPISGFIVKYVRPKLLIQIGLAIDAFGLFLLYSHLNVASTPGSLAPFLVVYGSGMGLVMAQISNMTLSAVSVQEAGEASGVNNTLRQVGSTLGSAIIGAVLLSTLTTSLGARVAASTVLPAAQKAQITTGLIQKLSSVEFGGTAAIPSNTPLSIAQEMENIIHASTVEGNRRALWYAAWFAVAGWLVSFLLPNVKNMERMERGISAAH